MDFCEKIFNNKCYNSCPENTKKDPNNSKICICDIGDGTEDTKNKKWYQYIENSIKLSKCNQPECPPEKRYLDVATNECMVKCNVDKYIYKYGENYYCYVSCP